MNTKDLILEKTLKLILDKCTIDISISEIRNCTGLTTGGIYYHFSDKNDIFEAIMQKYLCVPYFPVLCKFWQLCGGVNGHLLQEGFCHTQVCCTQSPCLCGSPLLTHTSTGDAQTQFCLSLCGLNYLS